MISGCFIEVSLNRIQHYKITEMTRVSKRFGLFSLLHVRPSGHKKEKKKKKKHTILKAFQMSGLFPFLFLPQILIICLFSTLGLQCHYQSEGKSAQLESDQDSLSRDTPLQANRLGFAFRVLQIRHATIGRSHLIDMESGHRYF